MAAGVDGSLKFWDLDSGRLEQEIQAHPSAAWGSAVSPDGRLIATDGGDRTARLWDVQSGERLLTLQGEHARPLIDVEFTPDGSYLATTGDNHVRFWALSLDDRWMI